jgi:hypothetical protein
MNANECNNVEYNRSVCRTSHLIRHDEGWTILVLEHGVGGVLIDEALGLAVHLEDGAEGKHVLGEIDLVFPQVFLHALKAFGGEGVAFDLFHDRFRLLFLAETIADIRGVAQGAGEMAFEDVGVQIVHPAAAAGIDEVFEVVFTAFEFLHLLAFLVEDHAARVIRHHDGSAFALDDDTDASTGDTFFAIFAGKGLKLHALAGLRELVHVLAVFRVRQAAHFKDERGLFIAVVDDLRVGRFTVVHITETTTHAPHAGGKFRFTEEPAGDVHLVDALVAEVAVAVGPGPVPVVLELCAHERAFRAGAAPEIVVDGFRNRLRAFGLADAGAALVAEAAREQDLSEIAFLHILHSFSEPFAAGA